MNSTRKTTPVAITAQTQAIKAALMKLRSHFNAGTPDLEILSQVLQNGNVGCSPATLEAFASKTKTFSTADVMQHFQVGKYKVAGSLASLTGARKIKKTGDVDDNGYSLYVWIGKK